MDISAAWGYAAVVMPKQMAWQGFTVLDPASIDKAVTQALATAEKGLAAARGNTNALSLEGVLSAAVAEMLVKGNEWGLGVFSSALSKHLNCRFWLIDTDREPGGTFTQVTRLAATTPEHCREMINARVLPLKMGQALRDLERERVR